MIKEFTDKDKTLARKHKETTSLYSIIRSVQ